MSGKYGSVNLVNAYSGRNIGKIKASEKANMRIQMFFALRASEAWCSLIFARAIKNIYMPQ